MQKQDIEVTRRELIGDIKEALFEEPDKDLASVAKLIGIEAEAIGYGCFKVRRTDEATVPTDREKHAITLKKALIMNRDISAFLDFIDEQFDKNDQEMFESIAWNDLREWKDSDPWLIDMGIEMEAEL